LHRTGMAPEDDNSTLPCFFVEFWSSVHQHNCLSVPLNRVPLTFVVVHLLRGTITFGSCSCSCKLRQGTLEVTNVPVVVCVKHYQRSVGDDLLLTQLYPIQPVPNESLRSTLKSRGTNQNPVLSQPPKRLISTFPL
jgi:hypothetical protein